MPEMDEAARTRLAQPLESGSDTLMTQEISVATRRASAGLVALGIAAVLALSACGGKNTKPGSTLAEAETAVARAERARIGDYDPASWKAARENLAQARASTGSKEADLAARWFAARAKADAELGIVRAERARLGALTQSLQREIATLAPAPAVEALPAVTP